MKRRKYPKASSEGDRHKSQTQGYLDLIGRSGATLAAAQVDDTDTDRIKRSYELARSGNARVWNTDELGGGENGIGTGQHFVTFEIDRNWVHVWPLHAPKGHLSQVIALRVWERIRMEVSTAVATGLGYSATDAWIDEEGQTMKQTKKRPRKKKKATSTTTRLTTSTTTTKRTPKAAKKPAASAPVTVSKVTKRKKKVTKPPVSKRAATAPVTKRAKKTGRVPAAPPIQPRSRRSKKKSTASKSTQVSSTFPCLCGCGQTTDRYFYRYGHQPRFEGWLRKIAAGKTREEAGMPKRLYNKLGPWRPVKGVTIDGGEAPTVHYTELRDL